MITRLLSIGYDGYDLWDGLIFFTLPQQIFGMDATKDQCCGHMGATCQSRLSLGFNDHEMFSPFHVSSFFKYVQRYIRLYRLFINVQFLC